MSGNPWHRRYHSDALAGMLSLTLEERGAYQTVLDMIYDRGGPVMDNERLLAGYMGCSIRKWRSLRDALIQKGKLSSKDGFLTNSRAEKELENDAKTARKLAENGSKGGRVKAENAKKLNENNDSGLAPLKQNPSLIPEARSHSIPLSKDNGVNVDPDKVFWANAVSYLGGDSKRSVIGKWCRDHGKEETARAITTAQLDNAVEPVSYVEKVLRRSKAQAEEMPIC